MATRYLTRSVLAIAKQNPFASFPRSYTTAPSAVLPKSSSFLFHIRPLVAAPSSFNFRRLAPALCTRGFASRHNSSSLNDPNPNWSNRPPKETILLDGCDFEHWLVVMEKPENEPTRDEIIDSYIKTLATVVGSEEEARMKIYSVSTRHYFAFGALVSEELSYKLKELPKVRWVLPDSYLDVRNKDYGGEPFINGQAVPYDPKYHEEWVRNNARANERNRRNDRPRNFDRSRNFERRRDMNNQNYGPNAGSPGGSTGGPPNMSAIPLNVPNTGAMQPNMHQQPNNMGGQSNYAGNVPPSNSGNYPQNPRDVPNNASNQFGNAPNSGGMPYQSGPGPNQNSFVPNRVPGPIPNPNSYASNMGPPSPGQMRPPIPGQNPNMGPGPGQNPYMRPVPGQNPNMGPVPGQNPNMGPVPGQYQNSHSPNMGPGLNSHSPNMGPGLEQNPNMGPVMGQYLNSRTPNVGSGQGHNQSGYGQNMDGESAYQNQNVPGRDFPPPSNY